MTVIKTAWYSKRRETCIGIHQNKESKNRPKQRHSTDSQSRSGNPLGEKKIAFSTNGTGTPGCP